MPRRVQYFDYLAPPMARRRKGYDPQSINTFRVLNGDNPETREEYHAPPLETHFDHLMNYYPKHPANKSPVYVRDHRHRNGAAWNLDVLLNNSRTLNAPVTFVSTYGLEHMQGKWWPKPEDHIASDPVGQQKQEELRPVMHAYKSNLDRDRAATAGQVGSTMKKDFPQWRTCESANSGATRHSSNPNASEVTGMKSAALGIVPVNTLWGRDGNVRVCKEKISFEHQFDSRDTNRDGYHPRGKRHGAFVWSVLDGANSSVAACLQHTAPQVPLRRTSTGTLPSLNEHTVALAPFSTCAPGSNQARLVATASPQDGSKSVWLNSNSRADVYGRPRESLKEAVFPETIMASRERAEREAGRKPGEPLVREEEQRAPLLDTVSWLGKPDIQPCTIP